MNTYEKKFDEFLKVCDNIKKLVKKFDSPYEQFYELAENISNHKPSIPDLEVLIEEDDVPVIIGARVEDIDYTSLGISVLEDGEVVVTIYSLTYLDVITPRTKFTVDKYNDFTLEFYSDDIKSFVGFDVNEKIVDRSIKAMKKLEQVIKKL